MATASSKSSSALLAAKGVNKPVNRELVSDSIAAGVMFALLLTIGQRVIGFGRGILLSVIGDLNG